MPIRPFKLPQDTHVLEEVIPPTFQYPENADWNVLEDDVEGLVEQMRTVRRIWPVIRILQVVMPSFRDSFCGFVWEEDDQPVGIVNVLRQGSSQNWIIGNVSVLPTYRRRGIARKLVEAAIDLAKERGARQIILDVVAGNVPAYALYERLGFTNYATGQLYDSFEMPPLPPKSPLPEGFSLQGVDFFNWRMRYQLMRRITPGATRQYEPVVEAMFSRPAILRPLAQIAMKISGSMPRRYVVKSPDGTVIAIISFSARTRSGGTNTLNINADPAHNAPIQAALVHVLHDLQAIAPEQRIECTIDGWQTSAIHAVDALGFHEKYAMHRMGMIT